MNRLDALRRRAWDSRYYELPAFASAVPTMLSDEEGKMLCWLGEHYFQGEGAVVDLGCFLGGSTARLASGLLRSGHPWTMHSYDMFTIDEPFKQRYLYSKGYAPPFPGDDMFHVFEKHIASFATGVVPHKGDVEQHPWSKTPIEILFVDLAKTVHSHTFVLENFFPCLIPGRSIIVQQDYIFFQTPWLITAMELLHPKLELISWTRDNSALFLCNEIPTAADLERIRYERLSQAHVEALFKAARDRFPFEWQREMLATALDAYTRAPAEHRAWAFVGGNWPERPSLGPWTEPEPTARQARAKTGGSGRSWSWPKPRSESPKIKPDSGQTSPRVTASSGKSSQTWIDALGAISGIQGWWDFVDGSGLIAQDGGKIASVAPRAGSGGNLAQATRAHRPTYNGALGAGFSGDQVLAYSGAHPAGDHTVVAIVDLANLPAVKMPVLGSSSAGEPTLHQMVILPNNTVRYTVNRNYADAPIMPGLALLIADFVQSTGSVRVRANGAMQTACAGSAPVTCVSDFYIGSVRSDPHWAFNGRILDVGLFSGALIGTSAEATIIRYFEQARGGVTV
jgi:hypothetical protein